MENQLDSLIFNDDFVELESIFQNTPNLASNATLLDLAIQLRKDRAVELIIKYSEGKAVHGRHVRAAPTDETALALLGCLPDSAQHVLHLAAEFGDTNRTVELIAQGQDINELDSDRQPPLECALESDALKTFDVLLEAGADVTLMRRQPREMITSLPLKICRRLADAWPRAHSAWSAMQIVAGRALALSELLEEGGKLDFKLYEEMRVDIVAAAVRSESAATLQLVLDQGARPTVAALHTAYTSEIYKILAHAWDRTSSGIFHALVLADLPQDLAQAAAAPGAPDIDDALSGTFDVSPLNLALRRDLPASIPVLLRAGASHAISSTKVACRDAELHRRLAMHWPADVPGYLHMCVRYADDDIAAAAVCRERILEVFDNAIPFQLLKPTQTTTIIAMAKAWPPEHPGALHAAIEADLPFGPITAAQANAPWLGRLPLTRALEGGHITLARDLLAAGAFADLTDVSEVMAGQLLRRLGPARLPEEPFCQTDPGYLHKLATYNLADELKAALDAGFGNIHARWGDLHRTPLHSAVANRAFEAARVLVEAGADVGATDHSMYTASEYLRLRCLPDARATYPLGRQRENIAMQQYLAEALERVPPEPAEFIQ